VYGFGAVAIYWLSFAVKGHPLWLQFLTFAAGGSAVEYVASLFQELVFGSTSWDYSDDWLNLGGRITLHMSLIWGLLGVLFIRFLYPPLSRVLTAARGSAGTVIGILLTVLMCVNLLVTSAAVLRWRERCFDIPAEHKLDVWLDANWPNETMESIYCNMEFVGIDDNIDIQEQTGGQKT
ncbi:MAG: putative ABC transporter permease, partial [Clostridia bacterium]|nr:putative ABC transporter permease [Clostridia bacterium]